MRKTIITLAICCLTWTGYASTLAPTKSFLALKAGLSSPTGKFGIKSFNDPGAGYALNGFHVAAEYGGYFNKNLGLSATLGLRRNAFDISSYNRNGQTNFHEYSGWRTNYFLGNLIWRFPLKNNFNLYLKGGGGVTFNTAATIKTNGSLGSGSTTLNEPLITAEALAYGLGSGFKWDFDTISLGLEAYYLNTAPTFSNGGISGRQQMDALNYSINLSFNFK